MSEFVFGEILGVSVVLFGFAAFLMGQAIAETWRPAWQNVSYGFVLAIANHFIDCALFHGDWLSLSHYLLDAAIIIAIALFAHRITLARKMVQQYPWLYERSGLLSWRDRARGDAKA
jgi:ABC-type uncharacterized transport system permease subunit